MLYYAQHLQCMHAPAIGDVNMCFPRRLGLQRTALQLHTRGGKDGSRWVSMESALFQGFVSSALADKTRYCSRYGYTYT